MVGRPAETRLERHKPLQGYGRAGGYLRATKYLRMYPILLDVHSIIRWLILVSVLWAMVRSAMRLQSGQPYEAMDKRLALIAMISMHTQLLLGLWLYMVSPMVQAGLADMASAMKDSILRFWAVEHITGMIIGIALVTVGYSTAKRAATDAQRYKRILIWFGLGILVVLATIPWPFLEKGMGRGWL
jgi:hypothetical protein